MINILLIFLGFSAGMAIATAVFAFITLIGVVTKLVTVTRTNKFALVYEDIIVMGGLIGCLLSLYPIQFHLPAFVAGIIALFVGMFVGSLVISLSEALSAIPILSRRIKIKERMPIIIIVFSFGKLLGSIIDLLYFY